MKGTQLNYRKFIFEIFKYGYMEVNKWKEMADLVRDSSAHVYAQMGRLNSGIRKIRK